LKKKRYKRGNIKREMFLILDIETTGLPDQPARNIYYEYKEVERYNKSRVIQICMQLCDSEKKLIKEIYEYINNGVEIPEEAKEIHKITEEKCKGGKKLVELESDIYYILRNCEIIIGHNINFDVNVLAAELYRNHQEALARILFYKKRFCTMNRARDYNIKKYKPRLTELYKILFDKEIEGAHDAKNDVEACKECFFKMIERRE